MKRVLLSTFLAMLITTCFSLTAIAQQFPTITIDLYENNPILSYSGTGWYIGSEFDASRADGPQVVKVGNTYYMFYNGMAYWNPIYTGLATSTDGINWTKYTGNPILGPNNTPAWCTFRAAVVSALYDQGQFILYFWGNNVNLYGPHDLGVATSTDAINWTISSAPILNGVRAARVLKFNGQYHMYYYIEEIWYELYHAVSDDGVNFTNHELIDSGGHLFMWPKFVRNYNGTDFIFATTRDYDESGNPIYNYAVSLNGIDFTFSDNPIVFEQGSLYPYPIGITSAMVEDDLIKFWGSVGVGNITWGYGNTESVYFTAQEPDWSSIFSQDQSNDANLIFFDDFNDNSIDTSLWNNLYGDRIAEEDGIMKIENLTTNNTGNLDTVSIGINVQKPLVITRKMFIHYANNYFNGSTWIYPSYSNDLRFGIQYYHFLDSCPRNGFYVFRNGAVGCTNGDEDRIRVEPIWDEWFTEKIEYDPLTGILKYYINDQLKTTFDIGILSDTNSSLVIHNDAGGWYTGHYMHMDDIAVYQEPLSNNLPTLDVSGDLEINEGETLSVQLIGSDPDTGDILTYTAENLPEGAVFDASNNSITWNTGYDDAGVYENIVLSVMDNGDPMGMDYKIVTFTVGNVNRPPVFGDLGPQSVMEGETMSFIVSALDLDGDNVEVSTDVGNLPYGVVCNQQNSAIACTWTPDYSQEGNYLFSFFATDDGSPSLTSQLNVPVAVGDVPTAIELADDLVEIVTNLDLVKEVINSYMAHLKKVKDMIIKGKLIPARNQLEQFINKVEQDISNGDISYEDGQNLINIASNLLTLISDN